MFASVRRYRLETGSMHELMQLIDTKLAEHIQEMSGFVEYQVLERGDGEIISITTFHDRAAAEASIDRAADWVRDVLGAGFVLNRLEAFVAEVAITRARSEVLEPERYFEPERY